MLNILVKVTLSEDSTVISGGEGDGAWSLVIIRGDAQVAAGTVGCTLLVNPADALGAQFPFQPNFDRADWEDFSASRMLDKAQRSDTVYNTLSGLFKGTELLLQCEFTQRIARNTGRSVLGISINDVQVLALPPMEQIEAARVPNLLASLSSAMRNGKPAPADETHKK